MAHFSLTSCYSRYVFLLANVACIYSAWKNVYCNPETICMMHLLFICQCFKYNVYCQYGIDFPVVLAAACRGWSSRRVLEQHVEEEHTEQYLKSVIWLLFKKKMYWGKPRRMIDNNGLDLEWLAVYKVYSEIYGSHHEARYHYECP